MKEISVKHITKFLLLVTLACSLLLCSCSLLPEKEKSFTAEGMSITLTNRFRKNDQDGFAVVYDSSKVAVFALKEAFTAQYGKDTALEEYAELVIEANSMKDIEIKTENGLTYFIYENEADGKSFSYLATVHKADDAFWLIQLATETENFADMQDTLMTYAKSIKLD